jgi:hypothetical protein
MIVGGAQTGHDRVGDLARLVDVVHADLESGHRLPQAQQPLGVGEVDVGEGLVVLVHPGLEVAADAKRLHGRDVAGGRQHTARRDDVHHVALDHPQVFGQLATEDDPRHACRIRAGGCAAFRHAHVLQGLQDAADGRRVDPAQHGPGRIGGGPQHDLGVDEGGGRGHPVHVGDPLHDRPVLLEGPAVAHEDDVGLAAQDARLEVDFEAGHHRDHDDQRHDPDGDPRDGEVGDQRDERLLLFGPQVPRADETLKRHDSVSCLVFGVWTEF